MIPNTSMAAPLDSSSRPPTTLGIVWTLSPGLSNQSRLGATATWNSSGTSRPDLCSVETRILSHCPGESVDSTITRSGPFSTFFAASFFETSCIAPSHGLPFRSVGIEMKWTLIEESSMMSFTLLVACMRPFLTRGTAEKPNHWPRPASVISPALMLRIVSGTMSYPTHLIPFFA